MILDGIAVAAAMEEETAHRLKRLGRRVLLAVLQVGHEPGGLAYLRATRRRCERLGIGLELRELPDSCDTETALRAVDAINADERVDGCLILRPMPRQVDEDAVCQRLRPDKDVDGITNPSLGMVFTGCGPGYAPCTAEACLRMLDHYRIDPAGARVVVVGRSLVVGRPLAMLLTGRDATVTLCHSRTRDLPALCREAEILISAVGRVGLIDKSYVNRDQVILDVGTSLDPGGHLRGDADFETLEPLVRAISPVPGGVGAVTTAVLTEHLLSAAEAPQAG